MSRLMVKIDGHTFDIKLRLPSNGNAPFFVTVNNEQVDVLVPNMALPADVLEWIIVDDHPYELVFDEDLCWLKSYHGIHQIEIKDLEALVARPRSGDGRVKAPIPGLITRLLVTVGEEVEVGQPLLVLEAMKMENEIRAPHSGVMEAIHVTSGQSVARNEVLAEIV